jgi:hypothetical protein
LTDYFEKLSSVLDRLEKNYWNFHHQDVKHLMVTLNTSFSKTPYFLKV